MSARKLDREAGKAGRRIAARREAELVTVYVVNGIKTSAGAGPGVKRLPPGEAGALVSSKHALYGDQPPQGGHL
jgi:hypothetical protein